MTIRTPAGVLTLVLLAACTSKEEATNAMHAYPFHDVKIGGYAWSVCPWSFTQPVGRKYTGIDDATGAAVGGALCLNTFSGVAMIHPDEGGDQ